MEHPTRGVIAGCGSATYQVQSYAGPPLDTFVRYHPACKPNVHVDDLLVDSEGPSDAQVVRNLNVASVSLEKVVEDELLCSIALHKSVCVASSAKLHGGPFEGSGGKGRQLQRQHRGQPGGGLRRWQEALGHCKGLQGQGAHQGSSQEGRPCGSFASGLQLGWHEGGQARPPPCC